MKKILLLILSILASINLNAQICLQKVDGGATMCLRQTPTDAQMVAMFGAPREIESHDDEAAGGFLKTYSYTNLIICILDGKLHNFVLSSNRYIVGIHGKYVVKVGDSLAAFERSIPASEVQREAYDGWVSFRFRIPKLGFFPDVTLDIRADAQGVIRTIAWRIPS